LTSNFQLSVRIPGVPIALAALLLISLAILTLSGVFQASDAMELRCRIWLPRLGIVIIAAGVLWNEFFVARFLSPHGFLQASTISAIRWLQVLFLVVGGILWKFAPRIAAFARWLVDRMVTAPSSESEGLLVLSLLVPWSFSLPLSEMHSIRQAFVVVAASMCDSGSDGHLYSKAAGYA